MKYRASVDIIIHSWALSIHYQNKVTRLCEVLKKEDPQNGGFKKKETDNEGLCLGRDQPFILKAHRPQHINIPK